jgi:hypothetical protein
MIKRETSYSKLCGLYITNALRWLIGAAHVAQAKDMRAPVVPNARNSSSLAGISCVSLAQSLLHLDSGTKGHCPLGGLPMNCLEVELK